MLLKASFAAFYFHEHFHHKVESFGIRSFIVNNEFDLKKILDDWDSISPIYVEAPFEPELYSKMTMEIRK
jgi:hypothetical protein